MEKLSTQDAINDDILYRLKEQNRLGIYRMKCIIIPLVANAICVLVSAFGITDIEVAIIMGVVLYGFILIAYYHTITETHSGLTREYETICRDRASYFISESIPQNPPLVNGFVYVRFKGEDYSRPLSVSFHMRKTGIDIDFNEVYTAKAEVGSLKYNSGSIVSMEELAQFKHDIYTSLEQDGCEVRAITNIYGDYLWSKGVNKSESKIVRYYYMFKIVLFRIILFICMASPLIWAYMNY